MYILLLQMTIIVTKRKMAKTVDFPMTAGYGKGKMGVLQLHIFYSYQVVNWRALLSMNMKAIASKERKRELISM